MKPKTKRINLALQGGGAHGAFTWGALERILEDESIEIAAISGTSAGALNGAALKAGLVRGGRAGAIEALDALWSSIGGIKDMRLSAWMQAMLPFARFWEEATPISMVDVAMQTVSPYAYGPFYVNPLTPIIEGMDMEAVCGSEGPEFSVSATNVRTGKIKVFSHEAINTHAILASACLPTMFQAVEVTDPETGETEAYWDGGYTGNPALFPLYLPHLPDDILIININPLVREELPTTPAEIQNRVNEISFNSSLLRELRAVQFVRELIADGRMEKGVMKDVLVHMIADDATMTKLSVATKIAPNAYLMDWLREAGRAAADRFLAAHRDDLNVRASVNLAQMYS